MIYKGPIELLIADIELELMYSVVPFWSLAMFFNYYILLCLLRFRGTRSLCVILFPRLYRRETLPYAEF